MQSPPVQPKKSMRSKSQSPPGVTASSLASIEPCSLEDVLDFDQSESVVTAFEKQLQKKTIKNVGSTRPIRREVNAGRNGRGKFGRASSMTFGSTAIHSTSNDNSLFFNPNNDDVDDRSSSFLPDSPVKVVYHRGGLASSALSLVEQEASNRDNSNLFDDDDDDIEASFRWPVPGDLTGRIHNDKSIVCNNNIASSKSSASYATMRHYEFDAAGFDQTSVTGTSNSSSTISGSGFFGSSTSISNNTLENDVIDSRRPIRPPTKRLQRSETLPMNSTTSFACFREPPIPEPTPFGNVRRGPRYHRSMSMLGSSSMRQRSANRWTPTSASDSAEFSGNGDPSDRWMTENADPSFFNRIRNNSTNDALLDSCLVLEKQPLFFSDDEITRDRKRIRERRHSIQGELYIAPLTETKQPSAFCKDPTLDWLISKSTTNGSSPSERSSSSRDMYNEPGHCDMLETPVPLSSLHAGSTHSNLFLSSPSNRSVTSSSTRKRGVCGGTPPSSSDIEDWSTSDFPSSLQSNGSARRRSRIINVLPGAQFPIPPPLTKKPFEESAAVSTGNDPQNCDSFGRTIPSKIDNRILDDDSDDDESKNDDSLHDVSMDSGYDNNAVTGFDSFSRHQKGDILMKATVFQNMSSYEDLKFMIKSLRKESNCGLCGQNMMLWGARSAWNVAPPVQWPGPRRSKFFHWASKYLGFTMRSAGMAVNFLQISKTKGAEVLCVLEAALLEHKQQEQEQEKPILVEEIELGTKANFGLPHAAMDYSHRVEQPTFSSAIASHRSSSPSPMESVTKTTINRPDDKTTMWLASKLSTITMNDTATRDATRSTDTHESKASRMLTRIVTIDPNFPISEEAQCKKQTGGGDHRTSLGSNCASDSRNLMMHLHGDSPVFLHSRKKPSTSSINNNKKPPKLSMESVQTTSSAGTAITPFGVVPSCSSTNFPFHHMEFLATPLMNCSSGWGSRPIPGKDWGNSVKCEESVVDELFCRLDASCDLESRRESVTSDSTGALTCRSSNNLEFDIEATVNYDNVPVNECDESERAPFEEQRLMRKRISNFEKRRRMSTWASAQQSVISFALHQKVKFRPGGKSFCPFEEHTRRSIAYVLSSSLSEFKDPRFPSFEKQPSLTQESKDEDPLHPARKVGTCSKIVSHILSFLRESELLQKASLVCLAWADLATTAHANLMLSSVLPDESDDGERSKERLAVYRSASESMERSWQQVHNLFPWACYLADGGAKTVYKVFNRQVGAEEALSVMDTYNLDSKQIVANELAVSALLSSLSRRGICPNFVTIRGIFTCPYGPPDSVWGTAEKKRPKGSRYVNNKLYRIPREPKNPELGRYQYIRMELVNEGDAEELIKRLPNEVLNKQVARAVLFQIAFALHAAADRFSVKHYDIKLLNVFLQKINDNQGDVIMRYGLGSHIFALRMPSDQAYIAKLADFGTASISPESNGQPVTIAQFSTLENTPPDFLILGDEAIQGHGHDNFGLGLAMLHLFTGTSPYEEILGEVRCPKHFKKRLRLIWENEKIGGYSVIQSLVLDGVTKDEAGHILEGDPNETFYDTLYRYLVLFGIPTKQFQQKKCPRVWKAISDSFDIRSAPRKQDGRPIRKNTDLIQYKRDSKKYSILSGNSISITRARNALESIQGGMDLLFSLCSFDPATRASSMDVLNSAFMETLREEPGTNNSSYEPHETVYEYTAYSTHRQ